MVLSSNKKISALLRGITSKNKSYSYILSCLHWFRTKNKLEFCKKVCENKKFNQQRKSDKTPSLFLKILSLWLN